MKFLDTNIVVWLLAADDKNKSEACYRLFQRVQRNEESVTTSEAIIAEVVYVLSSPSLYHLGHEDIAARLRPILSIRALQLRYKRTYLHALDLYAAHPFLDFEDALAVAHMERMRLAELSVTTAISIAFRTCGAASPMERGEGPGRSSKCTGWRRAQPHPRRRDRLAHGRLAPGRPAPRVQ